MRVKKYSPTGITAVTIGREEQNAGNYFPFLCNAGQVSILTFLGCEIFVPTVHGPEAVPRSREDGHHHSKRGAECW